MSIDTPCPSCKRILRVADEHAGKQARCPSCSHVYMVPSAASVGQNAATKPVSVFDEDDPMPSAPVDHSQWSMKTPEGAIYGPVDRDTLNRWLADGRIASDCYLSEGSGGAWRPAGEVFPQLRDRPASSAPPSAAPYYYAAGQPRASTVGYQGLRSDVHLRPHRGGLILVLGILGFFTCQLLGIMAWIMGSEDLREMRAGRMDPSGEGMTQAGTVLGMICGLLLAISLVLGLLALFFLAIISAAN